MAKGTSAVIVIWHEIILDISYDNFQCSFPYLNALFNNLDYACCTKHMSNAI